MPSLASSLLSSTKPCVQRRLLPLLLSLCVALPLPLAAEVYKRTLPDGSVEFTDKPPEKNARPMELPPLNTVPAPVRATPAATAGQGAAVTSPYQSLAISSPAPDATVRENNGAITVTLTLSPELARNHHYTVLLDGKPGGSSTSGQVTLRNIERGTHTLQARVEDLTGRILITSPPQTVHLRRATELTDRPASDDDDAANPQVPNAPMAPRAPQAPRAPTRSP